ncbi:MAG: exodeoxyribonuclease VII small subunit [Rhodospirillales bacterium]|jgi:exodeoxyribonuclease VII small subunit|nr:exodeoxyribonuclease VII small subunit [Rhodospirillales bacterium]
MAEVSIPADIKKMSFEEALAELEKIVDDLEQGNSKLDDAITAFERGTILKKHCEIKLREAKTRIEKVTLKPDEEPSAEPLNLGDG